MLTVHRIYPRVSKNIAIALLSDPREELRRKGVLFIMAARFGIIYFRRNL